MLSAIFRSMPVSATTVTLVTQDKYESRQQHSRGDGILMYRPQGASKGFFSSSVDNNYEIIIPRPLTDSINEAFSIYRSSNEDETLEMFTVYCEVIPLFVDVTKRCPVATLQEACDVIRNHKSWGIGHLLAHLDRFKSFEETEIQKHINDVEPLNGMTPIMVAIAAGKLNTVQALISLNCDLDILAHSRCSVLHFAASSNPKIVNALVANKKAKRWINSINGDGHTPLHLACMADNYDCVLALIIAGANANIGLERGVGSSVPAYVGEILQNNSNKFSGSDVKHGGTPLHWCHSQEVIELLLDSQCHIDAVNLEGQTALHLMTLRNRLDCAVALLSYGAKHSVRDKEGNTPLHLAVQNTYIDLIQALIVFGADVNCVNNKNESPRHLVYNLQTGAERITYMLHIAGAKRCPESMGGCSIICGEAGDFNGTPETCVSSSESSSVLEHMLTVAGMERASIEKRKIKGGRLLCLDGGGIRGLLLIQILLELEMASGRPIVQCFDWIAGTSTGGIVALALSLGKSLRECQCLYFKLKEHAFVGTRPYDSACIEKILKEAVGEKRKMSEIKRPNLMITGVCAKQKPLKLCMFRNYPSPTEIITSIESGSQPSVSDEYVWEVARSTSAAPSYFKAHKSYVDGGLIANNPTLDALTEVVEHGLALKAAGGEERADTVSIVVSCGTGLVPVSEINSLDLSWSRSILDTILMATRLKELGTLLVDLATCTDGRVVDRARAWCSMAGIPYYRFNPQMSQDVNMDEKSNKVLIKTLWEAKVYMYQQRSMIHEVAQFLMRD